MKPLTGLVVLLVMLFGLAACGGGAAPAAPAEVPPARSDTPSTPKNSIFFMSLSRKRYNDAGESSRRILTGKPISLGESPFDY